MSWLLPTVIYTLCVGSAAVTGKLALRTLRWPDLILWTGVGYIVVTIALLALRVTHLRIGEGTSWAMLSAAISIGGLMALYLALHAGAASKVVAVSAGYPAVTLVLSSTLLSEPITRGRVTGMVLVIVGVIVLTVSR